MNKMREIRKQHGLTMKELGRAVGVSESTISLYETGKHEPDVVTMQNIADVLEVSLDELFGRKETQEDDTMMLLRESFRRNPDMRILFDLASKATPEHVKAAAAMLKALEPEEPTVD